MISSFYFDKGDFVPMQQDALVLEVTALGNREAALLAVCDGIGGLSEGEYASSYVTMRLRDWFYRDCLKHLRKRHSLKVIEKDCIKILYDCNRYLTLYGRKQGIRLGTTVTMALLVGRRFRRISAFPCWIKYLVIHAGDSRAYLLGRDCRRLTKDDSHGHSVLCRCIGSFSWRGVQKRRGYLRRGEKMLLCSDGFWRRLMPQEMADSFRWERDVWGEQQPTEVQLKKRLQKLGQAGRERGEKDNQAAVVCGEGGRVV